MAAVPGAFGEGLCPKLPHRAIDSAAGIRHIPAMAAPDIVTTIRELRARLAGWRKDGARVGLVPTMGALHAGHVALIERARRKANRVVVSIFVNPAQFAPHEDFASYPRPFDADITVLRKLSVHLVWAPAPEPTPARPAMAPCGPAGRRAGNM